VIVAVTGMGVLTFSLIAPALPDLADALEVSRGRIGLIQTDAVYFSYKKQGPCFLVRIVRLIDYPSEFSQSLGEKPPVQQCFRLHDGLGMMAANRGRFSLNGRPGQT